MADQTDREKTEALIAELLVCLRAEDNRVVLNLDISVAERQRVHAMTDLIQLGLLAYYQVHVRQYGPDEMTERYIRLFLEAYGTATTSTPAQASANTQAEAH